MSGIPDDLDFSLVWAEFKPEERAMLRGFLEDLDVAPDRWHRVPAVRRFLVAVIMARGGVDIREREPDIRSAHDALVSAAQKLGGGVGWTVAERVGRRLRRWRARAGQRVREEDAGAA